jgi:hypothetical protein
MDSRSVSFRDIKNAEEASTSGNDSVNSLESMFSLSRSQSINHADIEEVETNPQAAWKLPAINPSKVYQDLNMFHLKAVTRVFVKESISTIQQNSNVTQTISLLIQKKSRKKPRDIKHSLYILDVSESVSMH